MTKTYTIEITGEQLDLIHRGLKDLVNGPDYKTLPDEIDTLIDMSDRENPDEKMRPVPSVAGRVVNGWCL